MYLRLCLRVVSLASFSLLPPLANAQMRHSTAPSDAHSRLFAILPMVGLGTSSDPIRPMFVPALGFAISQPSKPTLATPIIVRTGILGYHAQISDDGKSALVEFIAPNASAFEEILSSRDIRVQVFRKGVDDVRSIEAAFQMQKKGFSFSTFLMGVH